MRTLRSKLLLGNKTNTIQSYIEKKYPGTQNGTWDPKSVRQKIPGYPKRVLGYTKKVPGYLKRCAEPQKAEPMAEPMSETEYMESKWGNQWQNQGSRPDNKFDPFES